MKFLLIILLFCSCSNTFYVVRHAEKAIASTNPNDPGLSAQGIQRAHALNAYFANKKPDSIFVSKYLRTQQTAATTATAADIQAIVINQTDSNGINSFIKRMGKLHNKKVLIVGHSNTVPVIVQGLSGKVIKPIADNEYDNLYIIKVNKKHKRLTHSTYRQPSN